MAKQDLTPDSAQAAKSRARGYRTDQRLILMAYLVCGKLKHLPSNPWLTAAAKPA